MKTAKEKNEIVSNDFYNLEQLSTKVGISEQTLRDLIGSGKLQGYKKNGRYFVLHSDFIDYLKSSNE